MGGVCLPLTHLLLPSGQKRNHKGKAPCNIVRTSRPSDRLFELRKLLVVRKNTPEARLLGNEPVRNDTVGLTCGRCLPPAHASASAFRPETTRRKLNSFESHRSQTSQWLESILPSTDRTRLSSYCEETTYHKTIFMQ